jgi:hypothetical protein
MMISLTDHEKQQLTIVTLATVAVLALFWHFVIRNQAALIQQTQERMRELAMESVANRALAERRESYQQRLETTSNQLQQLETNLPAGDVFRWQWRTFSNPKTKGVTVISIEPPKLLEPITPNSTNYHTVSFGMSGKATYHDFGRFLADTENQFSHARLQRLELEPTMPDALDSADARKLLFQIELITLSKSPPPRSAPGE